MTNYAKQLTTATGATELTFLGGSKIRILVHGRQTNGRLSIIEYTAPPNGAFDHFAQHEFVEIFHVISGTLMFHFMDDAEPLAITAGSALSVPSYVPHGFWNGAAEPATVHISCAPAGLEQFFEESHSLLNQMPPSDERTRRLFALRDKYGIEHVVPLIGSNQTLPNG